ncbi:MAG: NfeD family protein [Candidatus Pelethousia sp.]|nr:NfeD family protein [Candidatus Pelethousia sp.]
MVMEYLLGWQLPAIVCLIVGALLMTYEMFTPGMGVPGALGALFLLAAVVLRADSLQTAVITLLLILVPLIIAAIIVFRSMSRGALSRTPIVLKERIEAESSSLGGVEMQELVGREGVSLSALRPSGRADFDGLRLDVSSSGEFIPKGARVRIERVEGLRVLVRAL